MRRRATDARRATAVRSRGGLTTAGEISCHHQIIRPYPPNPRESARTGGRLPAAKKRGGRRPGAGAPKGNLNGLKHGRYSKQLSQLGLAFAASPKVQVTLLEIARRQQVKQKNTEVIAAMIFANILKRGIEVKTDQQRRALADFKDSLDRI